MSRLPGPASGWVPSCGCSRWRCSSGAARSRPGPRAPLAYAGSGSIGYTVLSPLSEGFVRRGGRPVEAKHYVGSSEGFKLMMEGRAELSGLARSLKSTEKAQHPYYVIIGYAALAVYVHPDNPLQALSRAQLKAFFTGEVKNWKEVGGPDAPVELVTVGLSTGSGTADFFREAVLEGAPFAPTHAFEQPREVLSYVASHPHAVSVGDAGARCPGRPGAAAGWGGAGARGDSHGGLPAVPAAGAGDPGRARGDAQGLPRLRDVARGPGHRRALLHSRPRGPLSTMSFLRRLKVREKLLLLIVIILAVFAASHAVQVYTMDRFQVGGPVHRQLKLQAEMHDTVQELLGELHAARAVLNLMLAPSSQDGARQLPSSGRRSPRAWTCASSGRWR